ncbi:MAG TPA: hypothetical protein VGN73_03305 [Gemmatimonadaceae bacterium]|nr:hypothetical protein [Gemmatimonadaceae bacterium]
MSPDSTVFRYDPLPLPEILRRARQRLMENRALVVMGTIGIVLGVICVAVFVARGGAPIPPEGDLTKAASFDTAIGIYLLTLALLVPSAGFSDRGRKRWVRWHIGLLTYAYAIETVQIFRGIDPRFSRVATPPEQILGMVFFLTALAVMVLFLIMAVKFFRSGRPDATSPVLLAIRYGAVTSIGAFIAGIWMSVIQGRHTGVSGNILPLHALGFHGLQAVPLVALLLVWAGATADETRKWVHITGIAWVIACAAVAQQTIAGRSIFDVSPTMMVAVFVLVVWGGGVLFAFARWARPSRRPGELGTI